MSSYFRTFLENWLKTIEIKSGNILDIGGSQNTLKGRLKTFNPTSYKILDWSKTCPEIKQAPNFEWDINNLVDEELDSLKETFDSVFCLEVSEYLYDPMTAFRNMNYFLKKGGKLYLSSCFLYPIHPPKGKDLMRFTYYGIERLLHEAGFEILNYTPRMIKNPKQYMTFIQDEGYRYDKNEDTQRLLETGGLFIAIKVK